MSISGSQRRTRKRKRETQHQYYGRERQRRLASPGDRRANEPGDNGSYQDYAKLHRGPTRDLIQ